MATLPHQDLPSLVNENDTRDDDDISLTSTVAEANDEDKLWTVDCILSEREMEGQENKGVMEYLISWEGKPYTKPMSLGRPARCYLCGLHSYVVAGTRAVKATYDVPEPLSSAITNKILRPDNI